MTIMPCGCAPGVKVWSPLDIHKASSVSSSGSHYYVLSIDCDIVAGAAIACIV